MSSDLGLLIQTGFDITAIKYYGWATGTILFYDYLLTLADEVKYVWPEKKSFAFWLFMVNRYFPMTYQLWQFGVSYSPLSRLDAEICNKTAFYPILSFTSCTILAQAVLTLRMYAVTMKNIPIVVGFSLITAGQFALGAYGVVIVAQAGAMKSAPIPLDAYHICAWAPHRGLEIVYAAISLTYDSLAFLLTIYFVARSKKAGLKISNVLRTIVEDATLYFLFIFTTHLVLMGALIFGRQSVRFLTTSASGNVVYLPVMISRIMLSLKKSVIQQQDEEPPVAPSRESRSFQKVRFAHPQTGTDSGEDHIQLRTYRGPETHC